MKLRVNARDHKLVENDYGDPIFRFLGLHPSDLDDIIKRVNNPYDTIYELKARIEELEEELNETRNLI